MSNEFSIPPDAVARKKMLMRSQRKATETFDEQEQTDKQERTGESREIDKTVDAQQLPTTRP